MRTSTTSAQLKLPYRVDRGNVLELSTALRLADLLAETYQDPERIVARAAASSRYLVSVTDQGGVVGFMFVGVDDLGGQRVASLPLLGIDPLHSVGSTALTLLAASDELFDAGTDLTWTTTAQPSLVRIWTQHFGARVIKDVDPGLGEALWGTLGATPAPDDARICRATFTGEYTPSELTRIRRANQIYKTPCGALDAAAGDRLLLVARRR